LAYQPDVRASYDGKIIGMCGEVAMAEPYEGVGEAVMVETSVGTLQAR
jgi:hypothetical protein